MDLARRHTPPPAPRFRPRMVTHVRKEPGAVHLVGGGPGDPGLITSRGLELLRTADVVVHDRLIGAELLQEARADAELIDVGKGPGHAPYTQAEINALLVDRARRRPHRRPAQGRRSVRVRAGERGGGGVPRGGRAGVRGAGGDERHRGARGGRDSGDRAGARAIVRGGHRAPGRPRTAR